MNLEEMERRMYELVPNDDEERADIKPALSVELFRAMEVNRTKLHRIGQQKADRTNLQSDRAQVRQGLGQIQGGGEYTKYAHLLPRYEASLKSLDDRLITAANELQSACRDQSWARRIVYKFAERTLERAGLLSERGAQETQLLVDASGTLPAREIAETQGPVGAADGDGLDVGDAPHIADQLRVELRAKVIKWRDTRSEARREFDGMRARYRPDLAMFKQQLAEDRVRGSRTDFDRAYFIHRNNATHHLRETEETYQRVKKQAIAANAIPEDWPQDLQTSEFGDDRSNEYEPSEIAAAIAGVDRERLDAWEWSPAEDVDPNGMEPSAVGQHMRPENEQSLLPDDSQSQYRFATGRYQARIEQWQRRCSETRRGLERDVVVQHGIGFQTSSGKWI
ncbi:hypothetical protein LTR36_006472 [Oleoguttula mirabilis]|uniref:Uncharacterized protein n=1 Tax=Oleoguttula mirabilis TaxID=1507867 RepID=A0AAV9JVF3_9PEZI|nr:hypothetical protein LTR36_006472 [Oleoguttula mirabilis]